jgi:hypothetical protein
MPFLMFVAPSALGDEAQATARRQQSLHYLSLAADRGDVQAMLLLGKCGGRSTRVSLQLLQVPSMLWATAVHQRTRRRRLSTSSARRRQAIPRRCARWVCVGRVLCCARLCCAESGDACTRLRRELRARKQWRRQGSREGLRIVQYCGEPRLPHWLTQLRYSPL